MNAVLDHSQELPISRAIRIVWRCTCTPSICTDFMSLKDTTRPLKLWRGKGCATAGVRMGLIILLLIGTGVHQAHAQNGNLSPRVAFVDRAVEGFFTGPESTQGLRDFGFMSEASDWARRLETPRVARTYPSNQAATARPLLNPSNSQPWLVDQGVSRVLLQEATPNNSNANASSGDRDAASSETQTLGEAPEDQSDTFLRQEAVLMKRGSWEVDWGLYYAQSEDARPILVQGSNGTTAVDLETIRRSLIAPLSFRYGAADRIQILATVPVGWSNTQVAFPGFDDFDNIVGVGDVTVGFSGLLRKGKGGRPDVIVSFSSTAPTANPDFPVLTTLASTAALGTGHWGFTTRALFIQKVDPIVVFYGFGYRQLLGADFFSESFGRRILVEPGAEGNFQFGVGFAASSKVNLNASVTGAYVADTLRDGVAVEGTARQQTTLRFSSTIRRPDQIVEPFIQFNANGTTTTVVGITWTYSNKRKGENE